MPRELFTIYGPISVNSFGVMIALGLITFYWLITKDVRCQQLFPGDRLLSLMLHGIIAGVLGARLICFITDWQHGDTALTFLQFWQGGYSVTGAFIGITAWLPIYLYRQGLPIFATLDLLALYAPILQAVAKLGCFFAGCCYGLPTSVPWAITYTDPTSFAPLGLHLHPTQLYTVLILLVIFASNYFWLRPRQQFSGQIFYSYLLLASSERFLLDFWRDDRVFASASSIISVYQWIMVLFAVSLLGLYGLTKYMAHQTARPYESV